MQQVENSNFDIITQDAGKDEIGLLIHSFNQMTLQISDLVNEVFEFQLKEKEHQLESVRAELKFLQSQMDPHFLFNTLNAILVVCNRNQYKEITDIIKYLAKTLRYLIQWNDDLVSIGKEVEFTKMYLHIEKFRFQDKFHYNIDIEEGLENILIPKMIIQPFVENACKHGIQASKSKGEVNLRIRTVDGCVHITIEDNGVGMSPEQLESIDVQQDDHIGIQNVYRRLKLYYQSECQCYIQSTLNKGTTVHINLPSLQNLPNEEEGNTHV